MTYTDTLTFCRSVPRAARVRQGFPRIADFARHVLAVRAARAQARHVEAGPLTQVRRRITQRLQAILDVRQDLRRAAREAAAMHPRDSRPCEVHYAPRRKGEPFHRSRVTPAVRGEGYRKYHWHNGPASGTVYHPSTRHVSVPAAWMIRAIQGAA